MAHEVQLDVSVVLLPHLDFCDLLLERPMAMWNIFVFTIKSKMSLMVTSMHLPCGRSLKCVQDSAYHIKISTSLFIFFLLCHCFSSTVFSISASFFGTILTNYLL